MARDIPAGMESRCDRSEVLSEDRIGSVIQVQFGKPKRTEEELAKEEQERSIASMMTIIGATVDTYAKLAGCGAVAEFLGAEKARAEFMKEHKGA